MERFIQYYKLEKVKEVVRAIFARYETDCEDLVNDNIDCGNAVYSLHGFIEQAKDSKDFKTGAQTFSAKTVELLTLLLQVFTVTFDNRCGHLYDINDGFYLVIPEIERQLRSNRR